ncbi:amino acid adenylation domain-containing protein [Pacificoceanicola onchidii]|uniref:amino acid adenylation domain-containing protein n=1 Tax=Pacificoceanicola onchidii TaxID=2562685 RepID=UPI00145624D4|nr:amino acid adenylation domain-containing protein [Pacificoceanicola onchidii]
MTHLAAITADHGLFDLGNLLAYGLENTPDKDAITDGKQTLSFAQLEALAWRIASRLRAHGTNPGDRVAVIATKSALMPALALAIWKCGAVYVPLDQDAPVARLDTLVARIRPSCVLALEKPYAAAICPVIQPEEIAALAANKSTPKPFDIPARAPDDLAYIIFTSGSTGTPKGVEITHENLSRYFVAHNEVLRFTPASRVLSFAPFHFDVSIEDTLLPLAIGAFSYQYRGLYMGAIIRKIMASQKITHMIAVSTILTLISTPLQSIAASSFPELEMVMTGAEVCDPKIINTWVSALPNARVINAYGPTEATIVCLCHHIKAADTGREASFPIGTPLRDVSLLLLDEDGNDANEGELCIGGPLVMAGYFERPDLTAEVIFERDGLRYYRSGDICKRLDDGTIQFVGRRDDEVKLKGKRIHLGEIRQLALSLPGIDRVAIGLVERREKEIALIAFSEDAGALPRLRQYLAMQLPAYMRPTILAQGAEITLSTSGKTDEKTLLKRLQAAASDTTAAAFTMQDTGLFAPQTAEKTHAE